MYRTRRIGERRSHAVRSQTEDFYSMLFIAVPRTSTEDIDNNLVLNTTENTRTTPENTENTLDLPSRKLLSAGRKFLNWFAQALVSCTWPKDDPQVGSPGKDVALAPSRKPSPQPLLHVP